MLTKQCKLCKKVKPIGDFNEREDMIAGRYAWCKTCMDDAGRTIEYPPEKERGSGVITVNYASLRPGYDG